MDDVIVDWLDSCIKTMGLNMDNPLVRELVETTWGMGDLIDEQRMWDIIHGAGDDWWFDLKPLPWMPLLWGELTKRWPVCILTSPSNHSSCLAGKQRWIEKYLNTRDFLIGKHKEYCANLNSVLVDDRQKNCDLFYQNGGHVFQWPNSALTKRLIAEGKTSETEIVDRCIRFISACDEIQKTPTSYFYGSPQKLIVKLPFPTEVCLQTPAAADHTVA